MAYRLTRTAESQIDALLVESAERDGIEAAGRYNHLILIAFAALGHTPRMVGTIDLPRLSGVLAFPLRLLRQRPEAARRVRRPRHLVVYRIGRDGLVEILGLVHDRMVLSRAARRILRATDDG